MDKLYRIYMNARKRAWNVYDKLVSQGKNKDEVYADELYKKALRTERRAWDKYQEAKKGN